MNKAVPICLLIIIGLLPLCALPGVTVSAQNGDPTTMGQLVVKSDVYTLGDYVFTPPGDALPPVEITGIVHYPTNWKGGPLPLIVFMHGKHKTCSSGGVPTVSNHWPCKAGEDIIPNFLGFDYIARVLASNGYFVVSISANGIAAQENSGKPETIKARAALIKEHLDLWNTINTVGNAQFGTKFINKIDMTRIGLMGHSRGGEGLIEFSRNQQYTSMYGIKAVFVIAPSNTFPEGESKRLRVNRVPFAVLLPYCDGDVQDLEGVRFYDDSRYNLSEDDNKDSAPKHTILVIGANHNYYNTVWTPMPPTEITHPGARDDFENSTDPFCKPGGSLRLTDAEQRTTGIAYVAAFMRAYVGGEIQFLPLLTAMSPPLPPVLADKIHVSFHPPDKPFSRLDINRLSENSHLSTNALGGNVTSTLPIAPSFCGGIESTRCLDRNKQPLASEPHVAADKKEDTDPGLIQLKITWDHRAGTLTNEIPPEHRDISRYQALQFRASVNFENMPVVNQNFSVTLKDGTGATASIPVADFSSALFYPPGMRSTPQKVILNTVRLPLSAFKRLNLRDIRSVEFKFDQQSQGSLFITDIAFTSVTQIPLPIFSTDACLKDDTTGSELIFNTITGNYIFCCAGGMKISGVGRANTRGNVISLTQGVTETDRRVSVTMDRSTRRGHASLQLFTGAPICTIVDRDITNSSCSCTPAP